MLAKFTTHTEATLEELDQQIGTFDNAYSVCVSCFNPTLQPNEPQQNLAALNPSIGSSYPKLHSLSHLVDIIRRKSTTDNYHTGLGEALHPQSKKDYRRTNHQDSFKEQVRFIPQSTIL